MMKKQSGFVLSVVVSCGFLFTSLHVLANQTFSETTAHSSDRLREHERASQEILQTHFFTEGRGILVSPAMASLQRYLRTLALLFDWIGGKTENLMKYRWGFNYDRVKQQPVGIFEAPYQDYKVAVLGCVACHSGKAAGQFVVGLGNKNIDVTRVGKDLMMVGKLEGSWPKHLGLKDTHDQPDLKEIRAAAQRFARIIGDDEYGTLTQGLVPVSTVFTWFYRIQGQTPPPGRARGQVKVPALWGYGPKRQIGQFSDGLGDGSKLGWSVLTELTAGQIPAVIPSYLDRVDHLEENFEHLLPPIYPFTVNQELADLGKNIFSKNCSGCHGSYQRDEDQLPIYEKPQWIPWERVQTDADRLNVRTEELEHLISINPMADILSPSGLGKGYFAPRLVGIWARFPYLHNASVPNIAELLTPPEERLRFFSLRDSGEAYRFSQDEIGLTVQRTGKEYEKIKKAGQRGTRSIYDTMRPGHGSGGHPFGTRLSATEKRELTEYLKTL